MRRISLVLGLAILALSLLGCEKPLNVTDVSPKTGNIAGGEPIEIKGTGFHSNMGFSVYVGANKVDNVSIQGTETLIISSPSGNQEGPVDIRVMTDAGEEWVMSNIFTYVKETGAAMDIRDIGERKSRRE